MEDRDGCGEEDGEGVGEERWRRLRGAVRGIESSAVGEDGDGGDDDGRQNRWRWRRGGGGVAGGGAAVGRRWRRWRDR